ncbi:hypothetical protein ElyMa_003407900 [Elysia marginata]|uniref:Uncharacterized protein n=1 Tax=Elysia marginata TaxID=1093978 RepID=A0AAV4JPA5_9GAST|nr:hypothetical protein ElyMa_003407900 [Elysia marginata]
MEPSGSGSQLPPTTSYRAGTSTSSSSTGGNISLGSGLSLSHVASQILSGAGPSSTTPMLGESSSSGIAMIGGSVLSSRINAVPETAGSIGTGLNAPVAGLAASSSMSPSSSSSSSSSFLGTAECPGGSGSIGMAAMQQHQQQQQQVRPRSQQHMGCVSSILSSPALSLSIPGSSSAGLASPYGMPSPTTTTGPHGQPQHQQHPHHLSPAGEGGPSGISTTSSMSGAASSSSSSNLAHGQQQQQQPQQTFRDSSSLGEYLLSHLSGQYDQID